MSVPQHELRQILNCRRAQLADRCGAVARAPRCSEQRVFAEKSAAEMRVEISEHAVIFDERRVAARAVRWHGAVVEDRKADVGGVAEDTGIAEVVTGRDCRTIGSREGRKQRVRVCEAHSSLAYRGEGGGILGIGGGARERIGYKDDRVARGRLCQSRLHRRECECEQRESYCSGATSWVVHRTSFVV